MATTNVLFNRTYKDAVFKIIFNEPKELLSLYNALGNRNITDVEQLEINTLEDAVYVGIKNDLSFIIDGYLSLYEHQSTINPNMPLRGLFYFSDLYKGIYLQNDNYDIHSTRRIVVYTPKFVVFYNGATDIPDEMTVRLSDSFMNKAEESDLEVIAHVYNINEGHNAELANKCQKLKEYSQFVSLTRIALTDCNKPDKYEAIRDVINECISRDILVDILSKERNRIMETVLAQFDAEKFIRIEKNQAKEEGIDIISKLFEFLINDNRNDELKRAVTDKAYQSMLLKEYNLVD